MPTDIDIAWAAGLFEGEGCFTASRNSSGRYPAFVCCLGMTDEDVVLRFAAVVGCGTVREHGDRRSNRKTRFDWSVSGLAAYEVAEMLLPYLGHRRRQVALALMEQSRPQETVCDNCGESFKPRHGRGRPWKFCSDECRETKRAERDRADYFREYHRKRRLRAAMGQTDLLPDAV
jgi:hypothetical protein